MGQTKDSTSKKYSVALSFSGKDRNLAEEIAFGLKSNNVEVFYDGYEEHDLWGKDLYETLRKIYVRECRYIIMIITKSYLTRM